ncbi:MAG: helix-turn-helix transcriptional regulator [Clostridiales bacterium]|nr:helix-turn-helix transcriptional regulator [Clostridiales bacterium]
MIEAYKKRYRTLGLNIAYYRRQKGLTQEQLAEKAGIERSRVSKTEIAWVGTSLDIIFKIADALEVEPYKLFIERD